MSARTKKKKSKTKPIPKTKKKGNSRSDSQVASTDRVKQWIKQEAKLHGHKLKATTDPKLNYYCGICDKFRKATCKNDMFKHVDPAKTNSGHSKKIC